MRKTYQISLTTPCSAVELAKLCHSRDAWGKSLCPLGVDSAMICPFDNKCDIANIFGWRAIMEETVEKMEETVEKNDVSGC